MYPIAFGATNVPAARITWRQLVRSTSATGVRLSFCAASALRTEEFLSGTAYGEPDPTSTALSRNGTRHPHVRKLAG